VLRGIRGFGPSSRLLSARILDLSSDLPIVVEIIDENERIEGFLYAIRPLLDQARTRTLVTLEEARVVHYGPSRGGAGD